MMRANTRRGMAAADIVVNPSVQKFGGFDWRHARELEEAGYRGAEAKRASSSPWPSTTPPGGGIRQRARLAVAHTCR